MKETAVDRPNIVIAAYDELPNRIDGGETAIEVAAHTVQRLMQKVGLSSSDVDGVAVSQPMSEVGQTFYSSMLIDSLGLSTTWLQNTDMGGCSPLANVARAAAAIRDGLCDTIICINADATSRNSAVGNSSYRTEFVAPVGYPGPVVNFALLMDAYDQRFGLDPRALGQLAVAQRRGALHNENALDKLRRPIEVDDYLKSRVISEPLRLLDCVMRCDGGNSFLVTTAERARDLGIKRAARWLAYAEVANPEPAVESVDPLRTGFALVGPKALKASGLAASDIHSFHPYDDFLIAVLLQLEQIGFCPVGHGVRTLLDRSVAFDGDLPINPGGGQISAGQPGIGGGGLNLAEAVRQIFEEGGARQVRNHDNALVTGIGVVPYFRNWTCSTAAVLQREDYP